MRSLILLLACSLSACSSFKKDPKIIIAVHSQGSVRESPKTIFRRTIAGRELIFKVVPEFTHKEVVAFHPFPADNGTQGVALKLDFKGTNSLDMATRLRSGELLMTMVNGSVVDLVRIDKPVSDGIFTIWQGFSDELIAAMEKKFPRIKDVKSSSEFLDMTPSTAPEKKEAKRRVERERKEKAKDEADAAKKKAGGEFAPELPAGELLPRD